MKAFTVSQVARDLQVDRDTVYRLIKSGKLRAFKIGSDWRITERALEEFIRRGEEAAVITPAYTPRRPKVIDRGDVEYWKRKIMAIGKDKNKNWIDKIERKARRGEL